MASSNLIETIYKRRRGLIKPGLERVEKAAQHLGILRHLPPVVLVAGTNGKGTTCGFLWQLLVAQGWRVGLYSSPHLVHFCERIVVSGTTIDDARLEKELKILCEMLPETMQEELTFFELTTLLALHVFQKEHCQIVILEVGMGGRLDATNITSPICTGVTSIGRDHHEFLGHAPTDIAREKAGIMRKNIACFWQKISYDPAATMAIEQHAQMIGAPLKTYGSHFLQTAENILAIRQKNNALTFHLGPKLSSLAPYLKRNLLMATAMAAEAAGHLPPPAQDLAAAFNALEQEQVPCPPTLWGRFERLKNRPSGTPDLILDVSHNVDGVAVLLESLGKQGLLTQDHPLGAIVTILGDKDVRGILELLRSKIQPILFFLFDHERSARPQDLPDDIPVFASFAEAWDFARVQYPERHLWLATGSVAGIGHVLEQLGEGTRTRG